MRMKEIRNIAVERGIKAGRLKKGDLVRAIQKNEGNTDCFEDEERVPCDQTTCLWHEDCQPS